MGFGVSDGFGILPLGVLGSQWDFGGYMSAPHWGFGVTMGFRVTRCFGVTVGFWGLPLGVLGSHWGVGVIMGFGGIYAGSPLGYWGHIEVLGSQWDLGLPIEILGVSYWGFGVTVGS